MVYPSSWRTTQRSQPHDAAMPSSATAKTRLASGSPPTTVRVASVKPANTTTIMVKMRVRSISCRCRVSRGVMTDVIREPVDSPDGRSLSCPLDRSSLREDATGSATVAVSSAPGFVAGSVATRPGYRAKLPLEHLPGGVAGQTVEEHVVAGDL